MRDEGKTGLPLIEARTFYSAHNLMIFHTVILPHPSSLIPHPSSRCSL
jgi:hypothetical protein